MRDQRERMVAGALYEAVDPALTAMRVRARSLCQMINATRSASE